MKFWESEMRDWCQNSIPWGADFNFNVFKTFSWTDIKLFKLKKTDIKEGGGGTTFLYYKFLV